MVIIQFVCLLLLLVEYFSDVKFSCHFPSFCVHFEACLFSAAICSGNARLSEKEYKLQEELKRQIALRDDWLQQLAGDDGFQEVSGKQQERQESKSSSQKCCHNEVKRTDQQPKESPDVIILGESNMCESAVSTKDCMTHEKGKNEHIAKGTEFKPDISIIGTSIIKDVEPGRMFRDKKSYKACSGAEEDCWSKEICIWLDRKVQLYSAASLI